MATVALLAGLAGCATPEKFEAELNSWIGHTEVEIVEKWGPPSQVYENEAGRYLTWHSGGIRILPGHTPVYRSDLIGSRSYRTALWGYTPAVIDLTCKKTMIIQKGIIKRWRWEGNGCF